MNTRDRTPRTWPWIAWLVAFLALELPAALHVVPWPTLSSSMWGWLPDWVSWLLVAGLLISLAAHLSPRKTSVVPVAGFGGAMATRIAWVEWGWLPFIAVAVLAPLLWLALRPGEWECVPGDEPRCAHGTWLGAFAHRCSGWRRA